VTDYPPVINEESGGRNRVAAEKGLNAALHWRDAKFGDGRACVNGPEIRDADGGLI
jgi:enoyl-CoA hydratase